MKRTRFLALAFPLALAAAAFALTHLSPEATSAEGEKAAPLKILLIAGGCCHDYEGQSKVLKTGLESKINAEVTVDYNPDKSTKAVFKSYEGDDWAEGYDLILHDECSAAVNDKTYVNRILNAHKEGVPAVNLHCAMHSYRWGNFREPVELDADNAGWYEMIGLQSTGHGPKLPIDVVYTSKSHPITNGFEDWTTINEELYNAVQIFDSATVLAEGTQMVPPKKKKGEPADPDAKPKEAKAAVVWTNEYGPNKTRIFSTSLGHFTETVADDHYLDLVSRGILWAAGKLNEDGTPMTGYGR